MIKKYGSAIFWGTCFIIFTILLKVIDVQATGPEGSLIGFSSLNNAVFSLLKQPTYPE